LGTGAQGIRYPFISISCFERPETCWALVVNDKEAINTDDKTICKERDLGTVGILSIRSKL
jgi:hypothetical protein